MTKKSAPLEMELKHCSNFSSLNIGARVSPNVPCVILSGEPSVGLADKGLPGTVAPVAITCSPWCAAAAFSSLVSWGEVAISPASIQTQVSDFDCKVTCLSAEPYG